MRGLNLREDELKARVAAVAERQGKTPHGFMVEAIARQVEQAEQAEQDAEFHRVADARWAKVLAHSPAATSSRPPTSPSLTS